MEESKHLKLNEAKWDRWAESVDGKGWIYDYLRKAQSRLVPILGVKENMNFLDIGCGTGWAIGQVTKLVNGTGSFYGVDLSVKMIEKAKENFKDNANIHFIRANSESIPLDDNLFDIIICTHSFHHYLNPDKALKEMHRILKEGGKLYLLDITADLWLLKVISKFTKLTSPEHVKFYTTREFKRFIISSGLTYAGCKKFKVYQKVHIGEK